ncbi:MAG: hypothetical protein A2Y62_01115 [Candidatus Fischerbacteria bacterium RBG_13_37_8]|uniref:Uncharacterized protein n=1 Tax=Candidatus Fischerbacteria bacterium RBG_13_37_8 TaxID=1817863 RepID=A0A1F5VXF4_9BACT|nr:MAG: hypothetical protein A2Y62_01115 [Candidatus Fischerbacteria bacterium RBG_13_37_8]
MKLLKRIWEGWKTIAFKIGAFNAKILLTLFYFLILTIAAIPFKLTNDTLKMKRKYTTFWSNTNAGTDLESLKKQY